jgi:gas vesicle protein
MSDSRNDNSFQVGVLGLLFGFVAGAAAVILSDPDKREKVKEKATEVLDQGRGTTLEAVNSIASTIKDKTNHINKVTNSVVDQVEELIENEINKTEKKQ